MEGLRRTYGTLTALDDLSFEVPAGQVVGFLGPNGAGKTTTMRAIFGLTDLDAGVVRWNGAPVGQAQRRRFGYMPEERGLYPGMLVGEQIEYLGRLHGLSAADGCRGHRQLARTARHRRPQGLQGGDAVARQPAAGAAGRRTGARSRAAGAGRAAVGARPDRHRRHRPGAGRSGPGGLLRALQQPPARPGRGPLRAGDDHRPRPPGRVRDRWTSWRPAGPGGWWSAIEGDRTADWAAQAARRHCVRGRAVARSAWSSTTRSTATTSCAPPCEPDGLTQFSFERRRLSEVFREALA